MGIFLLAWAKMMIMHRAAPCVSLTNHSSSLAVFVHDASFPLLSTPTYLETWFTKRSDLSGIRLKVASDAGRSSRLIIDN